MRAVILALTIAGTGLLGSYSGAQAQNRPMNNFGDAGPPVVATEPKPVGPQVYGYYQERSSPRFEMDRPEGPGGCGVYFYWDGKRCADARNKL